MCSAGRCQHTRHPSVSACKLCSRRSVRSAPSRPSVASLISRGISSYSRSRTNKLSPNIGFAWQRGCLGMCVCGGGAAAYIKQRRSVNIGVWRINSAILKERLTLKHHSVRFAGPRRFPRPGSPFLICCISGKDGVQIKFPRAREVSLHTKQGCV